MTNPAAYRPPSYVTGSGDWTDEQAAASSAAEDVLRSRNVTWDAALAAEAARVNDDEFDASHAAAYAAAEAAACEAVCPMLSEYARRQGCTVYLGQR